MTEAAPQGQGQAAPGEAGQATQGQEAQQGKTLTWEEHVAENKRVGVKEHKSGYSKRDADLLEKAREISPDIESLDEVFAGFSEYQGIQEAVSTEADRANEKAERLEKRAKAAEERYTNTLQTYALRDALRDRSVPSDRLDDALALAKRDGLEVDRNGNVSGIEDVVEALLEPRPWLLETQEQTRQRVNAPQTSGTGVETPADASQDPKQNMGRSMLGWLTEPVSDRPQGWP